MNFSEDLPEWQATGTEPPDELKQGNTGWVAGYKPPASYFNWIFNRVYKCIVELRNKLTGLETSHNEDVTAINSALDLKAPLESPALTGIPTVPTASVGTATNQAASTKFVNDTIGAIDFSALQGHTKYVTGANLNTLLEDQAYICAGTLTNTPIPNTYCFVRAYDTASTNRILQQCWVPQPDNSVRTFIRSINGSVFGAWREIATQNYVQGQGDNLKLLIDENTFRSEALMNAMSKAIVSLFIEPFADTNDIDTSKGDGASAISSFYDSNTHVFNKTTTGTIVLYSIVKVVTSGNNNAWSYLDWQDVEGGSVSLAISRNNGTTYTNVPHNSLVSIASQSAGVTMVARLTLTGRLVFKNLAWGVK